jgi:hypothetical protein
MGQNILAITLAPAFLLEEPLLVLGISGGIVGTMATLDGPVHRQMTSPGTPVARATDVLSAPGRWYDRVGPDEVSLGVAGALAAGGLVLQRPRITRTAVHAVEAFAYTKVVTSAAKGILGRARPFATDNPLAFDDIEEIATAHQNLALPSGHTSRAFAMASVLSHEFDRWYVSVPAYGFAASVGFQRIHSGDHWLTDVVVGGMLGYAIGRLVTDPPSEGKRVTYRPIASMSHIGVSVHF